MYQRMLHDLQPGWFWVGNRLFMSTMYIIGRNARESPTRARGFYSTPASTMSLMNSAMAARNSSTCPSVCVRLKYTNPLLPT